MSNTYDSGPPPNGRDLIARTIMSVRRPQVTQALRDIQSPPPQTAFQPPPNGLPPPPPLGQAPVGMPPPGSQQLGGGLAGAPPSGAAPSLVQSPLQAAGVPSSLVPQPGAYPPRY